LRFQIENERIAAWLGQITEIAPRDYDLAVELAECQTLVKGYGDTHERGWASFSQIAALAAQLVDGPQAAGHLRGLRDAALADDSGSQLERAIAQLPVRPVAVARGEPAPITADLAVLHSPND
jgi:indolepyruvate ferredoxin oxidoreductase, beta subunit